MNRNVRKKKASLISLKDYYKDCKYHVSPAAIILAIVGFGGIYVVDKKTYQYTQQSKKQSESSMLDNLSTYTTVSKKSLGEGAWKCDYCGTMNKASSISCTNCYHRRDE